MTKTNLILVLIVVALLVILLFQQIGKVQYQAETIGTIRVLSKFNIDVFDSKAISFDEYRRSLRNLATMHPEDNRLRLLVDLTTK